MAIGDYDVDDLMNDAGEAKGAYSRAAKRDTHESWRVAIDSLENLKFLVEDMMDQARRAQGAGRNGQEVGGEMTRDDFEKLLSDKRACDSALEWVAAQGENKTPEELWNECTRADWLLWLADVLEVDRKQLVLAACACVELLLQYVPEGEERPREAIETARAWCVGAATVQEVRLAAVAAVHADFAAADAAAADAAYAAYAAASVVYTTTAAADAVASTPAVRADTADTKVREHIAWTDLGLRGEVAR